MRSLPLIGPQRATSSLTLWLLAELLGRYRLGLVALVAALWFSPAFLSAQARPIQTSQSQTAQEPGENGPGGSVTHGKALFQGETPFQNGGPACAVCHGISGLPFPNGGTLGPDLSRAYEKMGENGVKIAVETLYFPVMAAVYDAHPLTRDEQSDLEAFIKYASTQPPARENTGVVAGISFAGFLILLIATHFLWKDRLKSVRRAMVEKAMKQRR